MLRQHSRAVVVAVVWWLCSPDLQQYFNRNLHAQILHIPKMAMQLSKKSPAFLVGVVIHVDRYVQLSTTKPFEKEFEQQP